MLTNTKPRKAILLFLIAFLSFLGCNKTENETSSSLMMPTSPSQKLVNFCVAVKSGVTTSTTGFPMIDLGALGDPSPSCAYGVNNSGKVVGQVNTQSGQHAFLWSRQYGVKDLGTLGEPEWSGAYDINERGQVVGSSFAPGTTLQRAFLWSANGGMVNLGTAGVYGPENAFSMGFGINNRGEIVGETDSYAFLWTDRRGMVLLDRTRFNAAWDINDNGLIVGMCMVYCCPPQYHAVLWTDVGKILDLGTLKLHSQALGINNRGEVVGGSSDKVGWTHERIGSENYNSVFDHSCVPFIWTGQYGMSQLPMLGGDAGSAHAINERGQVIGWSYTVANEVHAFVWTRKNGIKDLGTLPGDAVSVAYGINNLGQVVGYSMSKNGTEGTRHAVIWTVK